MNKIKSVIAAALMAVAIVSVTSGCALWQTPVPTAKLKGQIGGQTFSVENPKDLTLTNLLIEVSKDGHAKLSIGYISTVNNSNVISAAGQQRADEVNAFFTGTEKLVNAGANIAGKAAAAAVKP